MPTKGPVQGTETSHLGFSVTAYGLPHAPWFDERRGSEAPHLSVSLLLLRDILYYLRDQSVHMYRVHTGLGAHAVQPESKDMPSQILECAHELRALGELARAWDIRLSFHPYSAVVLNAANEDQVMRSVALLDAQAAILDGMGLGPEAVIVVHVGGVYDNIVLARERFVRRYAALPEAVQRRLVLENDDHRFGYADVRMIHELCGIPLVLDRLHHLVFNREGVPMLEALNHALGTWPPLVKPKVHFASPRTEMGSAENPRRFKLPAWTEHSDFVNPFEFVEFMRASERLRPFDVMLEAKAHDMAVLQLRKDVVRFAPEWAGRVL